MHTANHCQSERRDCVYGVNALCCPWTKTKKKANYVNRLDFLMSVSSVLSLFRTFDSAYLVSLARRLFIANYAPLRALIQSLNDFSLLFILALGRSSKPYFDFSQHFRTSTAFDDVMELDLLK